MLLLSFSEENSMKLNEPRTVLASRLSDATINEAMSHAEMLSAVGGYAYYPKSFDTELKEISSQYEQSKQISDMIANLLR
jgi:hypothetical protein